MRSLNRRMSYLSVAALMAFGSILIAAPAASAIGPPVVQSEKMQASAQASGLLNEIRFIAHDLRRDAARLESFKFGGLSWQVHADQLTLAKQHINAIGSRVEKLQAIRSTAEPWQQRAIDAIIPVAVQLASQTETAMNYLNDNRRHLLAPAYTDHLSAIANNAVQMKQAVDVFLDLNSTEDKLDDLRDRVAAIES